MPTDTISPESLITEYIRPEDCSFYITDNGFTGAVINGKEYKRVVLKRALPLSVPDSYICVMDVENNELGILEHIGDFTEDQRVIIEKELSLRYFTPVIQDIISIKEKMGHFYFDVTVDGKKKSFTVKDLSKNIRTHDNNIDITDVDGNRFRITDLKAISSRSRRKLEPYLY